MADIEVFLPDFIVLRHIRFLLRGECGGIDQGQVDLLLQPGEYAIGYQSMSVFQHLRLPDQRLVPAELIRRENKIFSALGRRAYTSES